MPFEEFTLSDNLRCREFTIGNPQNSQRREVHGVIWDGPNCQPGSPIIAFGYGASGDRHQLPIPC